jgi:hypothetical protein
MFGVDMRTAGIGIAESLDEKELIWVLNAS